MSEEKVTADNYDEETFEPIGSTPEVVEPAFQSSEVDDAEEVDEGSAKTDQPEADPEEKSVAHFQRVAQEKHDLAMQKEQALREKDAEVEALNARLAEIEKRFQPETKEEVLTPPKPADPDEPLDRVRYAEELAEYTRKMFEKEMSVINAERKKVQQQKEMQETRSKYLSAFMDAGASADEASKAYEFGFSEVSADPNLLLQFMRWHNGQKSQPTKKTNTINAPLPAGITGGESEDQVIDPNKAFNEDMERFASRRGSWV